MDGYRWTLSWAAVCSNSRLNHHHPRLCGVALSPSYVIPGLRSLTGGFRTRIDRLWNRPFWFNPTRLSKPVARSPLIRNPLRDASCPGWWLMWCCC